MLPIVILLLLGTAIAYFMHKCCAHFWRATIISAVSTGLIWVIGFLILIRVTAPAEGWMGWSSLGPALSAFILTSLIALAPAWLVGLALHSVRSRGTS